MTKDFQKGLIAGLVLANVVALAANYVITKQEKTIKHHKRRGDIMAEVAEALEQHVDPVTVREILAEHQFDVITLREFGE